MKPDFLDDIDKGEYTTDDDNDQDYFNIEVFLSPTSDIDSDRLNNRIKNILEKLTCYENIYKSESVGSQIKILLRGNGNKAKKQSVYLYNGLRTKSCRVSFTKEGELCKDIYISKGLIVRNINSNIVIPNETIEYSNSIIEEALKDCKKIDLPKPTDPVHHSMIFFPGINPDIPILLKDDMPSYEEQWKKIDDDRKKEYIPKGKVLGYYTKYDEENFCKGPHIVLGPEIIKKSSEEKSIPFEVLFTKVLVHELAHAMMDNSNNWPSSLEAKAMEESLANKITLNWFRLFASNEFKYVKHYIDNYQPAIYKFGIWQDHVDADWTEWRKSDKQSSQKLQDWFNQCFSNGRIKIPIEDYSKKIYMSAFK